MLKVLEISGYPPPYGGWTMRTEQLKKRLDAEGHRCVVLNTGETRRVPSPHYETVESGAVYLRKVWRYCRAGYLLHTHANGEAPKGILLALVAQCLARCAGRGSVLTFHAGSDQLLFPRANAPHWAPVFWLLFRTPNAIICNSEAVKRGIVGYGVAPNRVVPIPAFSRQYVEFVRTELPPDAERHFQRYPRSVFSYLAMRATFHPDVLLRAFAQAASADRELGLFVCGVASHADAATSQSFHQLAAELAITDRLCVVGDLSHDEFLTAMTRSLVYVRTPPSDGVCSSVLEALTLGVRVVASDNGTRPKTVTTYEAEDPDALARALQEVLRQPADERASDRAEIPDTVGAEIALLARVGGFTVPHRMAAA